VPIHPPSPNQPVIDLNLVIIHFPSGDGLGCPSSDGKYRDDGRSAHQPPQDALAHLTRIYPHRPAEPLVAVQARRPAVQDAAGKRGDGDEPTTPNDRTKCRTGRVEGRQRDRQIREVRMTKPIAPMRRRGSPIEALAGIWLPVLGAAVGVCSLPFGLVEAAPPCLR
jgi:hypothetical protein